MGSLHSLRLQFPTHGGVPLYSARVGWARVLAAQAVQRDWERLTTAFQQLYESQPWDGSPGLPISDNLPGAEGEGPQHQSQERPDILTPPPENLIPLLRTKPPSATDTVPKIGIVGAGAAGLFTAMILKWLKAHAIDTNGKSFNYNCDIIEASDTFGGRLSTHSFSKDQEDLYFDVGAMRYPQNNVMKRTFDLFSQLGMMPPAANPKQAKLGQLVSYYMQNKDCEGKEQLEYFCYNDRVQCGSIEKIMKLNNEDPFGMGTTAMQINSNVLGKDPNTVLNDAIHDFRKQLQSKNAKAAWDLMMSYDKCSARAFLSGNYIPPDKPPYPKSPGYNFETVEWLENFNGGTGWYDQALSEIVLESIDFDEDPKDCKPWDWFCIFGGSVQLAKRMVDWLDNSADIKFQKRVSKISCDNSQSPVTVKTTASDTWTYDAVFNSTTLPTLNLMDLSGLNGLPYTTKQAIRCLAYGPSAKVGMVFSEPWWRKLPTPILSGGQGHSDLNIRTCVYPSYNIGEIAKDETEFVLLCSYTWQADAERIGSLIGKDGDEPELIKIILRDLARMHASDGQCAEELLEIITKSYTKKYYAHDWTHDPNTAGAFAFFRPGQFMTLWPHLNRANGSPNFYIIGEHASAHHAWVVGALESAVAGVYQWLCHNSTLPGVCGPKGALALLKAPQKGNPFVGLPAYIEPSICEWNRQLNMMESLLVETLDGIKAARK